MTHSTQENWVNTDSEAGVKKHPTAENSPPLRTLSPLPHSDIQAYQSPLLSGELELKLAQLRELQANHSFWQNSLFRACKAGGLGFKDLQFIFGQYSFYSRNFTRYLAGFMANSDNDMHRAQLVENLWEESGETDLSQRHAELFRCFLTQGLGIVVEDLVPIPATQIFVKEILSFCLQSPAHASSAFLSLGTEGIVPRMYEIFIKGLQLAGVADEHLTFFHLHTACDDEHAVTLEKIMVSYASEPGWFESCCRALTLALDLREQFFEHLYQQLQVKRIQLKLERIQGQKSLANPEQSLQYSAKQSGDFLYRNKGTWGKQAIDFSVERFVFPTEVLDSRLVRIAPGKTNERHRHAHEAIFLIKEGQGTVWIDRKPHDIEVDDIVFVPRWAVHQVKNTGDTTLVILAITDFGLTSKAFMGNYLKTARMHANRDADYFHLSK
ncbi:MAG: iron-containing redox enzyme family protein [Leptolyngbya sp. SIO1E4]|nr:iron-containing redox enzyme family protein [Leptolyngbya sp. SIO1E4]